MRSMFAVILSGLIAVVAFQGALAENTAADQEFAQLARKVPGFRMIENRPPVPDMPFLGPDNKRTTLKDFEGKALLINFWATWCTPCVREMPDLNAIAAEFSGETFDVVAIASGQQVGKNPDAFLKEHELDALKLYMDPHASLMTLFGTKTLPTTLLVDKSGRILGGVVGAADWNAPPARAVLAHLMQN